MTGGGLTRVAAVPGPLAMFESAATRQREQQLGATLPSFALMRRAGLATARLALALAPHAARIVVVVGPGNNGGDGLEAAATLHAWGKTVLVWLIGEAAHLPADAMQALAHARAAGVPFLDLAAVEAALADAGQLHGAAPPSSTSPVLWIDALLGIGSSRPPQGLMREVIAFLAVQRRRGDTVLAIDVPSGLDADRGEPWGDAVVAADHTLTLLTLKPGLFTAHGRDQAGDVWLDTLSAAGDAMLKPVAAPAAWLTGSGSAAVSTLRPHAMHKGSFGDVAVVGGAKGMVGAALLAARAALAAGTGRVYLNALDTGFGIDVARPELMCRSDWWHDATPESLVATTVVCGCGGGDAVRTALPRLLALAGRLLLDADALNAIAGDPALQTALSARAARQRPTVITPHPLEGARLLGTDTTALQRDRLTAARQLAERFRCLVVLKGSGTVIAAPGEVPCINATGNASLASAGTGDVLAGWLGGHWAQHEQVTGTAELMNVVTMAVADHGRAAEPQRPGAIRAADLVERLHNLARGA